MLDVGRNSGVTWMGEKYENCISNTTQSFDVDGSLVRS